MEIRDATPEDWSAIWPFLRAIVRAGETYTLPRDLDEAAARADDRAQEGPDRGPVLGGGVTDLHGWSPYAPSSGARRIGPR